jgi:mannose-6-phosphate isomerase class I
VSVRKPYDPLPCYPCVAGEVGSGWAGLCAGLPAAAGVLAVDGPAVLDWDALVTGLTTALRAHQVAVDVVDVRDCMAGWEQVVKRTAPAGRLRDDPDFATLPTGSLADLFDRRPAVRRAGRLAVVFGPGAALAGHDLLWYADLPKRYAEAAVTAGQGRNLGQPRDAGPPSPRRLFYLDWPLLDRHRDALAPRIDCWIDTQQPAGPRWLGGAALRASLRALAGRPFRTRPVFNSTPWGGHWAQTRLGLNPGARNTALGYELIAPESGIVLGSPDRAVEVPLQLLVALHPRDVLGPHVHQRFGTSFPVRFDYLDTAGGGNLSVHCHPRDDDMREVFGWPYPQHETYYVMAAGEDSVIYLGLRDDAPLAEFAVRAREAAGHGVPFDIERFVQTFPARPHQLFCVPAGTPHGSGAGNVVLEVSATPYLYSLRFYDWLRRDADGTQRPVHVEHAFRNLDTGRRGGAVRRDLVQQPRTLDAGNGWRVELLGALPEMFFEVRRLVLGPAARAVQRAGDRFHVLNLVDGDGVTVHWSAGAHQLSYAETIVIPAATGSYQLVPDGPAAARVLQAVVR